MEKIYLSWSDIEAAIENLASQIKNSGETIEAITGLPRGGLILLYCSLINLNYHMLICIIMEKNMKIF